MTLQARYTILRKIADGGTAEIFLATQHGAHGFEKPVVLKRIFPAFYADPQFRNMLVDEAHIAMSLNHSNIVQVLDLGEADGQYVLALELVDGWTLDAVFRRARAVNTAIPPALALYMTAEVCRALAYAHAKTGPGGKPLGIVHRDISPHNVLLSEQGEVKLTDFGIAKAHNRREYSLGNMIKGKIAYMSPEQASGGPLDGRSDLFSVGTMLYVMICRRYPFDAPTDLEVLLLVKNGECAPPESARPGLNPEIYRVLKRAMAKAPGDRYQRAEEMLVDVEQVMRVAFRAVGQTELKRWLQDLSVRDGVPPLTRAPIEPATAPAGRAPGETLELKGVNATTTPPPPGTSPPSGPPRRLLIPTPPSLRSTSASASSRPPPPPAALAVTRKSVPPPPPRGPNGGSPETAAASRIAQDVAPAHEKSARTSVNPPDEATDEILHEASEDTSEEASEDTSEDTSNEASKATAIPTPGRIGAAASVSEVAPEAAAEAVPETAPAAVSEAAQVAVPEAVPEETGPTTGEKGAQPAVPRRSSSWVAEAVLAAAERAGAPPPPPPGATPPPPPPPLPNLSREIASAPVVTEPAAPPRRRRLLIAGTVGSVVLLVVLLMVRGFSGKHADSRALPRQRVATAEHHGPSVVAMTPEHRSDSVRVRRTDAATAPSTTTATTATASPPTTASATENPPLPPDRSRTELGGTGVGSAIVAPNTATAQSTSVASAPTATDAGHAVAPAASGSDGTNSGTRAESETDTDADRDGTGAGPRAPRPRIPVAIQSSPSGALVTTPHHQFGSTPVTVRLKVGSNYTFTFTREGYRTTAKQIHVTPDPDQELSVTLRKAPPAPPPTTSIANQPPPAAKPHGPGWLQRMFSR